jgi:PD-(D/E)XK nuclease superfamily protein
LDTKTALTVTTAVVGGPLAYHMRRAAAARARECGLQILTLPQLAARLVGGFTTPVTAERLEPAIREALNQGGFSELERVRHLPGMTRAIARTLHKAWDADLDLRNIADAKPGRMHDLALIEDRVKTQLPQVILLPRALRDAALTRIQYAFWLLGPVRLEGLTFIAPVWRPLIKSLAQKVPLEWCAPKAADTAWFSGLVTATKIQRPTPEPKIVSCADPHHEVVECLRWARQLIASGAAKPSEIAFAAASTTAWDDHFLALTATTGLRLHFSHGIPALATRDGQRCAALADILLHGLSHRRVRRLALLCAGQGSGADCLSNGWLSVLPRGATLPSLDDWQKAIAAAKLEGANLTSAEAALPLLALLAKGPCAAKETAGLFLRGQSLQIWETATRSAPAEAIELSLRQIRLGAETDAADSVVWCPARDLAAATRPWVRLLGLTSRAWPRRMADDPIVPHHVLPPESFDPDPVSRADRRHFHVIVDGATGGAVLSRSRRGAQGSRVGRSPLLRDQPEEALSRAHTPEHAFSEADRLMARPEEASELKRIKSATQCWQHWHVEYLTPHDGQFQPDHPVIRRAIERVQSATSLRRLLRDPLGFVWRYGLGWTAPLEREQPLTMAPEELGKLVHELLRGAVDALEPEPGYAVASEVQLEAALVAAAEVVRKSWPLERPVPPRLLWNNTVDYAADMALAGLMRRDISEPGTRSWTEIPFGQSGEATPARDLPWDVSIPVTVPGTPICLRGTIDRLDMRSTGFAVRVTDYKSGQSPKNAQRIVIAGGAELQRALYGLACRQLLPGPPQIITRLIYLAGEPLVVKLENLDAALALISEFVSETVAGLQRGMAAPGPDAHQNSNYLRLALPASPAYERRKRQAFSKATNKLWTYWNAR